MQELKNRDKDASVGIDSCSTKDEHEQWRFFLSENKEVSEELMPNPGSNVRLRSHASMLKKVPSMFLKASSTHSPIWSIIMFGVVFIAILLLILVSKWNCLVFETA